MPPATEMYLLGLICDLGVLSVPELYLLSTEMCLLCLICDLDVPSVPELCLLQLICACYA